MDLRNPVSGKLFIYVSTFLQYCSLKVIDRESFSEKVIPVPPHRCPVKHELLGMEPVPAEEPWVFGNDNRSVLGQCRTLLEELVGINHRYSRTCRGSCSFFCGHFFSSLLLPGFLLISWSLSSLPHIPAAIHNLFGHVSEFSRIRSKERLVQQGRLVKPDHP